MNSRRYWKNRIPFLLTNLVCMAAITVFLLVCGNSFSAVLLILVVWALVLLAGLFLTYWTRKRQMQKLLDMAGQLSERYLISEVMELPEQAEDQVYYQLLKMAGKSMLEQIGEVRRERLEYKEYIEQWIHEIKTPITAMKLLCENHRTDWTKELLLELEKTNRFTEQALYYARSEHTEKDYSVREMSLSQVVHQAIADNKYLLLQSGVRLEVEEMEDTVYSDEKWVRFILNQLIANAVKYRSGQPVLRFSTRRQQDRVLLVVGDNGIGISSTDLPRIFEKGFTGQNGRMVQQSTGIGLYLCKRLCDKLDIGITVESSEQGTSISLAFHINCLIHEVQG
ncbi:sensor histidine kinase [Lachnoclostridium sp. An118]|uniref:sensor histidine kinase n=1 Tax=Lachnoclostridium sp. An118 TaxID=1965547 RepID=UPI000B38CCBB|nr:sensor histidine kinase [Lachnoclostridium sp. An118]OUQ51412.1 histidine kinase [Lachnoclostridium sp. An118]